MLRGRRQGPSASPNESHCAGDLRIENRDAHQQRVTFARHRESRDRGHTQTRFDKRDQCRHMARLEAALRPVALRCKRQVHHQPIAARLVDGHEVVATEISPRDGSLAGERMVAMARSDEGLAEQRLELDSRLIAARNAETELRLPMRDRGKDLVGALIDDMGTNPREPRVVLAQNGGQEVVDGRGDACERDLPPPVRGDIAHAEQYRVKVVQQASRLAREIASDGR